MQPTAGDTRNWIAVVGMSGRFPGARDIDQFWDNLVQGRDSISRLERADLVRAGVEPGLIDRPDYVPASPVLDDIDQFDAAFFGISPREAKELTPAMRLFLECCWEAFEDAGHVPGTAAGPVGVFAGANMSNYWRLKAGTMEPTLEEILGNDKDYLATHVAYKLDLRGPAVGVQTACSTSLVAIHLAAQALIGNQCDMALAGGAAVRIPHESGYLREEGSILSPDGRCRPFDAAESGPVFGSGVGVVLLKRFDRALADGDRIRAVIRGSAVNNDGAGKVGFAAPSVDGQAAVVALAQALADTPARTISYVEAHGTGTRLGDPIEIAALDRAFGLDTQDRGFCAIGSAKGNVGHLETAAGVAGFIKTVLALAHREIPPSLHFERPNSEIDFTRTPFFVNTARRAWAGDAPRRAGVSSFGMGGTNAHLVLEEAPPQPRADVEERAQLIVLSARTTSALARAGRNLAAHLRTHPEERLADIAFTLGAGRARFRFRRALVVGSVRELAERLALPISADGAARDRGQPADATRAAADLTVDLANAAGGADAASARHALLERLADLWRAGADIDWKAVVADPDVRRTRLPTYPFERQRFWVEEGTRAVRSQEAPAEQEAPKPARAPAPAVVDAAGIRDSLCAIVGKALHLPPAQIDPQLPFMEFGADSLVLIESVQAIQRAYGVQLAVRDVFETLTTVAALAAHIEGELRAGRAAAPQAEAAPVRPPALVPPPAAPAAPAQPGRIAAPRWGIADTKGETLDPRQQGHLDALIARYTAKTAGSKRIAAENRATLADVRATAGFKLFIKEMLYPIVVERSRDGHVVDVDGNDYVDVTMGFGVHLFGHKPAFLTAALADQLERDVPLGPENRDSGVVARLMTEMAGVERVAFFNTGTEAVMTALRLVRARSKRDRIVLFKGSYHGHADLTLAIGLGNGQVAPLSGGVPADTLRHLVILDYGDPEALRTIEALADDLAAVVVEPVQSRYPDRQPADFLRELRRITEQRGVVLMFDEMITGFRIGPGGAQAWFGVQADIVTYGKIVGGGMPVGVIGGKAAWLDCLDGGQWRYGDASFPASETIFYAGTFNKNPWTMAAARVTLEEIRRLGPALYTRLNRGTAYLATTLNAFFAAEGIPMEVVHFASLFRFVARGRVDLFFFHMIERGIYVWEGRNCFLSHAHSDADIEAIIDAAKASVLAMRDAGLLEAAPLPRLRHPLTDAQRQLLLLGDVAEDGLLAYNIHLTTAVAGEVDADALELALNGLVRRHEALRTIFPSGVDHQEVLPALWLALHRRDFGGEPDPVAVFAAWFETENHHRFDLAEGPPLRAHLLRLGPGDFRIVLTIAHIVGDGITLNILLEELTALYGQERTGRLAALPPPVPFGAYAAWQSAQMASAAFRSHERYWLERLVAPLPQLDLPLDHPRPAAKRHAAAVAEIRLDADVGTRLRRYARERQATVFATCLAAFLLLLHRIGGDEELLVGVPTGGRGMEGGDRVVGYCTHLLPIRSRLAGEPGFRAHLDRVKSTLLDAFEHQDYPFAALLTKLDLPRDPSRPPLLSATFNMDRPPPVPSLDGAAMTMLPPPVRFASYELAFNVTDLGGELVLECRYHTSLFAPERMDLMLRQYEALLRQVADGGDPCVFDFDLGDVPGGPALPDPSLALPQPAYALPLDLMLRHADAAPERPAIVDGAGTLSYGDLARQSQAFARLLVARGAAPGDRVAVAGPRDARLVAAFCGIWRAGAAFVALDPNLPAARRSAIVALSGARFLLDLGEAPAEPVADGVTVLRVGRLGDLPAGDETVPLPAVSPEDAACVFFTSGTTGVPKGIVTLHKGIAHFVAWQRDRFGIGADDRVAQLTGVAFDAVLRDIFLPLSAGGTLHIPTAEVIDEAERLVDWICRERVTVLHTVPSRAASWLAAATRRSGCSLRHVFFSGEPLTRGLVDRWRAVFGEGALLVNLYGSTETTMTKCYRVVAPDDVAEQPLGAVLPMSDTQALVMRGDRRCGVGEPGEIVIRTPFRTAGYVDGGIAAAFAHNSYLPGDLLYRSGDRGRYRPDGSVEVEGRLDDQVKIRGVRVQPAEVKAVIDAHPAVASSAVVARTVSGDQELIAYVVAAGHAMPDASDLPERLRQHLVENLPLGLVPRAIVVLPRLPLLPTGKVDRAALPEPEAAAACAPVPPRDGTDALLLAAWADVLPVAPRGVRDNFFELGGNSLSATRIVSRVRSETGMELPLKALFECPTVETLADRVALLRMAAAMLEPAPADERANADDWALAETL